VPEANLLCRVKATRTRQSRHKLVIWENRTLLLGKERKQVEEAKRYSLDVVGISSTKRLGSNDVELGDGRKLFYSGVEQAKFAHGGVRMLVLMSGSQ